MQTSSSFPGKLISAIGWFLLSLVLLCLPGSSLPKYPWLAAIHADKWVHIGLFGILCALFCRLVISQKNEGKIIQMYCILVTIGGIFYGITMEFVQKYWIAGRSFEPWDIVADSIGCILGYAYSMRNFPGRG